MIPQALSLILATTAPSPIPLSTPLQIADADADLPTPARYHHRARHSRHHTRPHVRVRSDPPGVKWTELPPEPSPDPTPPSNGAIRVRTTTMPATTPLLDSTRFFPPTIGPAQARAYCIAHRLECAGASPP